MKKNPSIGNLSEEQPSPDHQERQETEGEEEEDYEMKFPS